MKKLIFAFILAIFIIPLSSSAAVIDNSRGYILLQVEENGEAWYVNPSDDIRYYMKDGAVAYQMMRNFGLGITDTDLAKVPSVADTAEMKNSSSICYSNSSANRLKGKILLQVQQHGEAWYVYPKTCRMIYMKDGAAAYSIMRFLGLGITNSDLTRINLGTDSLVTNTIGSSNNTSCLWTMKDGTCSSLEAANAFCLASYSKDYIPVQNITGPGYYCLKCAEGRTNINGDCGLINTTTIPVTTVSGCIGDYVWNSDKTACVTKNEYCVAKYGTNNYFTGEYNSTGNFLCGCKTGYMWNTDKTSCIAMDEYCKTTYGTDHFYNTTDNTCKTTATSTNALTNDQACQNNYGTYSYSNITNSDGTNTCGCVYGYIFNSSKTSCIPFDEYCKITYGADRYYDASKNVCTTSSNANTNTSTQTGTSLSSICDQYSKEYILLATGVGYSDPIYFSARDNLAEFLNQYCGGTYSKLPSLSSTSSKIYFGYAGASATCSTNSIGYTTCRFSDGSSITSNTDSIGYTHLNYSNGSTGTCSTDSLGYTTCNYSGGASSTCSTDSLGYTNCRYSDGSSTTCNIDTLGYLSCY